MSAKILDKIWPGKIESCRACKGELHYLARGLRKTFRKNRYGKEVGARGFFFVACMFCGRRGPYRSKESLAIKAWNEEQRKK